MSIDEEIRIRRQRDELLAKEIRENNPGLWWLSFCDTTKKQGEQFLGVVIVRALGVGHAIKTSFDLEINPGGQVMAVPVPDGLIDIRPDDLCRLLTHAELQEAGYVK